MDKLLVFFITSLLLEQVAAYFSDEAHTGCTVEEVHHCKFLITCNRDIEYLFLKLYAWPCGSYDRLGYDGNRYNYQFHNEFVTDVVLNDIRLDNFQWYSKTSEEFNRRITSINITITDTSITEASAEKLKELPHLQQIHFKNYENDHIDLNLFSFITTLVTVNVSHNDIGKIENNEEITSNSNINNLDLSFNVIESVPNGCFLHFPKLQHIDLSNNIITKLNGLSFDGLTMLQSLDLSKNNILEIGQSISKLTSLREVSFKNNYIKTIVQQNFMSNIVLQNIDLSFNEINSIEDESFENLSDLKEIDLSNSRISKINNILFQNNNNLKKLNLYYTNIASISIEIFKNKDVDIFGVTSQYFTGSLKNRTFELSKNATLDLSNSEIDKIESEAFFGSKVSSLNISFSILEEISPSAFKSAKNLENLDLSNNQISRVDFDTSDLKNLKNLDVHNNTVSLISRITFQNLDMLKILDLSHNKISNFDKMMFLNLRKLEYLDLSYNNLENSLEEHDFIGLSAVETIKLTNNKIKIVQKQAFFGLKAMKYLNFTHNEIYILEFEAFANTGAIQILDISHNDLQAFHLNSTSIQSLQELYLNHNKLRSIDKDTFSALLHLKKIYLNNNNFASFDYQSFVSLAELNVLDLSSNPTVDINILFSNLPMLSELSIAKIKKKFSFEHNANKSITKLDLSGNDIENINTVFIYRIEKLEILDLKSNKITFIDKDSFKELHNLVVLDLSFNLISSIQPGSFIHANSIKNLNLHHNKLRSLPFGIFKGLRELETLNLSSNNLHEFQRNILHDNAKISFLALDDNYFDNFKFEDFPESLEVLSLGNNPVPCHILAEFDTRTDGPMYGQFKITAEHLDPHSRSYNGIKCEKSVISTGVSVSDVTANTNGSLLLLALTRTMENLQNSIQSLSSSVDKSQSKDKSEDVITQNFLSDILKQIDSHIVNNSIIQNESNRVLASVNNNTFDIKDFMKKVIEVESKHKEIFLTNINDTTIDYHLQEKIETALKHEKDMLIKEIEKMVDTKLKNNDGPSNKRSEAQINEKVPENNSSNGLLYFVATCLIILIILAAFIVYSIFKPKINSIYRRNLTNSVQPISEMEM